MKLRKCKSCKTYTLNDNCPKCKSPTTNAHYKFVKHPYF
ncbi:MAG: nucleolar RNA-binding Nop10p family protein [archaeon]